jgi:hypothetical protein
MLFFFTHTHPPEDCPALKPANMEKMQRLLNSAEEEGIHIHGMCICASEHNMHGVVEADSAAQVEGWLSPVCVSARTTVVEECCYPSHYFFSFGEAFSIFHPATEAKATLEHHFARLS